MHPSNQTTMLAALVAALVVPPFCPPQPWALDIGAPPRWPMVADVNGDGYADLVVVYPEGDSIIDVSLSQAGQRSGRPFQGLSRWHPGLQAATVGPFGKGPGLGVAGIFNGDVLALAVDLKDGKFTDVGRWVVLPKKLAKPILLAGAEKKLIAASSTSGDAYTIDVASKDVKAIRFPKGVVWAQTEGAHWAMRADGQLGFWDASGGFRAMKGAKVKIKGSLPAATGDEVCFNDEVLNANGVAVKLPEGKLPIVKDVRGFGDVDHDGDQDIVRFRYGTEHHTAYEVELIRAITSGETDYDHDGLTNEEEAALGTDPYNPDTDNDGLLDGWEVHGYRGLDLKGMGCDPRHMDVLCYISPFEGTEEKPMKDDLERARKFYTALPIKNPDGKTGLNFHPIFLPMLKKPDTDKPWWENRDRLIPPQHRGITHWMQITGSGGGQADQLGDGGGCGGWKGAAYATFIHEFGHQMGLDHTGFWGPGFCPIYPSLMNYAYSYGLEDDGNKIRYSTGDLASDVLHEEDLDETLPFPYEKVKFLEKGPYRYKLKPNGATTLIDWNWNGVFGEKHVRADINYGYGTSAGTRDDAGRGDSAPWLLVHKNVAHLLFAQRPTRGDGKADNSVNATQPGALLLRRLVKPFKWLAPAKIEKEGVIGDPTGVSFADSIWLFYQTKQGLKLTRVDADGKVLDSAVIDKDATQTPTVSVARGRLWLFLWNPKNGLVTYKRCGADGRFDDGNWLNATSVGPVSMVEDTIHHDYVVGLSQNQTDKQPGRWQIRRYKLEGGELQQKSMEWLEGAKGGARGYGRCVLLFDRSKDAGPDGRLYYFARGGDAKTPATCNYVGMTIADKTKSEGWLIKRYYDEWSNSRSPCAAAWFDGDIIYCYRWIDGRPDYDGMLHVGYRGMGIDKEPMGDFDDVSYIANFGIRHSIIYLGSQ